MQMPYTDTCFRFYTQMGVQKKTKHLHIEFIVTSHNSGCLPPLIVPYTMRNPLWDLNTSLLLLSYCFFFKAFNLVDNASLVFLLVFHCSSNLIAPSPFTHKLLRRWSTALKDLVMILIVQLKSMVFLGWNKKPPHMCPLFTFWFWFGLYHCLFDKCLLTHLRNYLAVVACLRMHPAI